MRKIEHSFPSGISTEADIFDTFLENMQKSRKAKCNSDKKQILSNYADYINLFNTCSIHTCEPYDNSISDRNVTDNLTKSDFESLYVNYLRNKKSNGRFIYEHIKLLAKNICPYCDISEVSALDHFLPISSYPQFSVFSHNLIASCTLCNTNGKSTAFPTAEDNQIIHVYLDDECFFNEQWINARFLDVTNNEANSFVEIDIMEYYLDVPQHWQKSKVEKAKFNFELFDLANRFGNRGNVKLGSILKKASRYIKSPSDSINDIIDILDESPELPKNHWESIFYQSLFAFLNKLKEFVQPANFLICPRCEDKWKDNLSCDACNGSGWLSKNVINDLEYSNQLYQPINCPNCIGGSPNCQVCAGRGSFLWEDRYKLLTILKEL